MKVHTFELQFVTRCTDWYSSRLLLEYMQLHFAVLDRHHQKPKFLMVNIPLIPQY